MSMTSIMERIEGMIMCRVQRYCSEAPPVEKGGARSTQAVRKMDAESDPVPSFLPFQLPQCDADAFIDELYFEAENMPPQESVMNDLNESRTELYSRVQTLKKDLKDWRGMLNTQVKSYREEVGDLRDSLNSEVERLKSEFSKLRSTLNDQMETAKSKLADLIDPEEALSPTKHDDLVSTNVPNE